MFMQIDDSHYTRTRVMVTTRVPKFPGAPATPWVILEAEGGSGQAIAMLGPDTPESRADAARMMRLWNDSLESLNQPSEPSEGDKAYFFGVMQALVILDTHGDETIGKQIAKLVGQDFLLRMAKWSDVAQDKNVIQRYTS